METLLAGAGGCTAYDVLLILQRGRHDVRGCTVKLQAERAETDPKVFTKIHLHFTVTGRGVPERCRGARRSQLSHEKYCSATLMLAKTADIRPATRSSRAERRTPKLLRSGARWRS
jgi:putative redox protein